MDTNISMYDIKFNKWEDINQKSIDDKNGYLILNIHPFKFQSKP
jgi:hypothetical protein